MRKIIGPTCAHAIPQPKKEFICTSCGQPIDVDHNYCEDCDQRGGEWVEIEEKETEV